MVENNKPIFVKISAIDEDEYHLVKVDRIVRIITNTSARNRNTKICIEQWTEGKLDTYALFSSDTVAEIESKILNAIYNG